MSALDDAVTNPSPILEITGEPSSFEPHDPYPTQNPIVRGVEAKQPPEKNFAVYRTFIDGLGRIHSTQPVLIDRYTTMGEANEGMAKAFMDLVSKFQTELGDAWWGYNTDDFQIYVYAYTKEMWEARQRLNKESGATGGKADIYSFETVQEPATLKEGATLKEEIMKDPENVQCVCGHTKRQHYHSSGHTACGTCTCPAFEDSFKDLREEPLPIVDEATQKQGWLNQLDKMNTEVTEIENKILEGGIATPQDRYTYFYVLGIIANTAASIEHEHLDKEIKQKAIEVSERANSVRTLISGEYGTGKTEERLGITHMSQCSQCLRWFPDDEAHKDYENHIQTHPELVGEEFEKSYWSEEEDIVPTVVFDRSLNQWHYNCYQDGYQEYADTEREIYDKAATHEATHPSSTTEY